MNTKKKALEKHRKNVLAAAGKKKPGGPLQTDLGEITFKRYNPETGKHEPFDIDFNSSKNEVNLFRVDERYTPKGRKLRKSFERPRPDLPSDAPANRTKRQVALTLPPDLVDELNGATKDKGLDRNAFIEKAIRNALKLK